MGEESKGEEKGGWCGAEMLGVGMEGKEEIKYNIIEREEE